MSDVPATLTLQPDELLFSGVKLNQVYCQTVTVTNPSKATVEATLRAGSSDRYTISPTKLVLKPHQSIDVDVRLRILRYAQKQKAVQQGQRDIFHIKAAYFEQKFYATFFLVPEAAALPNVESSQIQRRSERTRSADSRSPRLSPRDRSASSQGVHLAKEHPAAGLKEPTNAQQEKFAAERQGQPSHEPASLGGRQPAQGHSSRSSTPDLSPRGDPEADDPPTPRMYKSIVPTAALSQAAQHHSDHSHSQGLHQSSKTGNSQMIMHQGHFDHGKHDNSPPRRPQVHEGASQQAIEDLQQTIRDKDGVIATLESQLAAARYRITVDERAAKVPSNVDTAGMSLQSQSQVERLQMLNVQLEGSNAELRDRVHELSAQAEAAQAQAEALQGLQASLQDSAGPSAEALVEAAVGRERALQDTRNKKVLELLNNKDEVIQRFEDRCTEATAEVQQLREALQETSKRLEAADNRLASTIESRNKLRRQLDAKQAEMTTAHASLQADNEVLKDKLKEAADRAADRASAPASPEQGKLATRLRAELEVHKEALATAKREAASLASSLEKANSWIESLNNQVASKDEDLQAHHERYNAKDEQIAGMAQRVEQLESLLEEQRQKEAMRQAHDRHDWAVDLSDQGMGLSSAPLMPSSPGALRQRVLVLEGANEKLEKALMAAHSHAPSMHASTPAEPAAQGGPAVFEATISSLRSMLSDREQQLSRLEADLAVAKAYSGASQRMMGESAQGESALRIELDVLRQRLTEKEAQVVNGEERLSRLEAVHRVAQDTALRSESQLESTRRSLMELDEDKQAGKEETESARALAMRLNARVSELTLAAECARTDGESARAELERVRSRHQSDIQAFEKRQKQLVTALKAVGGQAEPLALADSSEGMLAEPARQWSMVSGGSAGFAPTGQPSDALLAVRDKNQSQAIQEAELAVAIMQAKLLEAVARQREAARQLQAAHEACDGERAHLEQQVRRGKEEGSVRIQTLEDTIRKLGNRSDLHQELARLGGEASFLRRTEARLKSNLGFAEDRSSELQREVTILRQQVASYEASEHETQLLEEVQRSVSRESSAGGTIAAKMKGISHELSSEGSKPHIVAHLVERAEASEVQLAQAQQELKALKQTATARAAAEGAGTSAAMSAAQVLEERSGDLHRQLLLARSELKAAKEDLHIQELDKAHLQTQLAEASREVAAAQSRVADKERLSYDVGHVTAQQDSEASNNRWKEATQAARQRADAERRAESSQAAQQEAEQKLRMAQLEVARLKASLESKTKALRRAEQAAQQRAEHAQHELAVARQECARSAGDAEDRKVQLSVLVETVETLQAGTPGEKEQRVVSLTAQLTTARMKEAVSERRASQLQCELEEQAINVHKLQSQLDKAEHRLSEMEVEASVSKASVEAVLRDISALKGELKAYAEASAKAAHEVDDARNSAAKTEAEATGLRAALEAARNRHFEQLTKERADAVASLRQARAESMQVSTPKAASPEGSLAGPISLVPQPSSLDLAAGIGDLMAALKPRRSQAGGGASEDGSSAMSGDDDMPHRVVRRMKAMLLDSQALSSKAQADLRIAAAEAAALSCKLRPLEAALERVTVEKEAAVAELQAAAAINATRQAQADTHADQHASLQARRLAALSDQLDQANVQIIQLSISLKHAHGQESRHKWQRDALQRKLAVCETDVQSLEARLSAAHMESAGTADASRSQSVEAAIQQRDSDIRAYFDTHVLKHVLNPDHQKRSLALTREICGLKVAHQQLIAAHAAARKLADAASLQGATLRQQLQALEQRQSVSHEARNTGQDEQQPGPDASAQLASKAHEIYRLQEDLLQHRQKLANQEIGVQELHAALQIAKNKARQAEDDGHRALEQARQQLTSEFAAERDALLKEVQLTKQQQQQALAQSHKDAVLCQQDFAEQLKALTQQSELALNARPAADQYNQVVDAANAAHDRSQEMEAECHALQQQNQRLQSVVRSLEVQVSELQADAETRGSALESLEQTLGKIERSADSGRDRSPLTGVQRMAGSKGVTGGSRPGTASGLGRSNVSHANGALAALSRQLVQAKMAEADAQRKHRVSARAELSLRQRLSQREDRISELKDAVAVARSHQPSMHANHSRHPSTSPQHYHSDHMHQPQHRHPSDADIHTQSEAQSPRGQFQQRPKRQPEHQQDCALSLETSDTQQEEEEEEVRQTASPRGRSHHWVSSFKDHRQEGEQGGPRTSPAASPRSRSYQASRAVGSQKEQGEYVGPAVAARLPYFCPGAQAQTGQSQSASEGLLGTRVNPQTQLAEQRAKAAQNASGARTMSQSPRGYGSAQQLAGQVSDLKIELARRDAEVEYLEGQLAEAVAANRPHVRAPTDHSSSQDAAVANNRAQELDAALLRLQRECSQAVAAAQAMLGRPTTPRGSPRSSEDGLGALSVQDVVQQLMVKLKDRDASVKRLRAVAKSTAEKASKEKAVAAAQPLEASQRAVIRDLSLRVANLTRTNNQLKEERERAQERLRTLRASLGSSQLPPTQEGPHPRHPKPPSAPRNPSRRGAEPPSTSTSPQLGALAVTTYNPQGRDDRAAGDPARAAGTDPGAGSDPGAGTRPAEGRLLECEAVQGLCQLLEHHVAVLEQSQKPVGSLLQSESTQAGPDVQELLASSEAMVSQGARQALAAAAVAASAELAAMRSTLQVLSSHLDALHAGHTLPPGQGATAGDEDIDEADDRSFLQAVHSPKPPMLALPAGPHQSRQQQETAVQTLPVALSSLSPEASVTQDELLAEQLQQAADRGQKWKSRCVKLRQELMETQTSAAALEAALNERLAAVEKSSEEVGQQHRKEVSRLEAALAGAEAAKKQLGAQQAQYSTAGESDLQAANAAQAEADARASSLQRQIDTLRAQAAASRSGLQDEAKSLQAALAKEKSERARIVLSLRDTITGLKQAGDVEGRLKADLVQTHEDLAASRAAQEQMEARLAQKRSEVKSLSAKLETAQRQLSQRTADAELANQQTTLTMTQAQHQITALEGHLNDSTARTADLTAKLTASEAELKQATESSTVMEKEVARLEQVNKDAKAACQSLQATVDNLSREHHDGVSAKWEALLRCRRHRAAVQQMRGELQAAESENSSLNEELSRARARGHQAAADVDRLQKKIDDLQHLNDMERQQLAERHVSLMSELERRMEEERDALRREAAAMAASAAAAGEDRARTALSARLDEAQQSAFQDITNVANERRQLSGELEDLRSQFKAYQKVKTREICSLEHRVRILLQSQAVAGTMRRDDHPASASSPTQHHATPARSVKKSPRARYGKPVMMPSSESVDESDAGNGSEGEGAFPASYQAPLAGLLTKGKVQCASLTAAAEVGMALESEAVASAVREADFERMQREAAEAGIASLQDASEKLKQKLKAAQRESRAARDVASCSAAQAAGAEASQQDLQHLQGCLPVLTPCLMAYIPDSCRHFSCLTLCLNSCLQQLQEQLQASQEALKTAKAESARRLKSLQSLQQQGSEGPHLVANAAFLAEKTAKESAEGKLTTLRRTLAHKDELLKTLKTKVDDLEAAVRVARAADHSTEVQAAESRVRSLQGSLSRKEDIIRELKEHMEQACRSASEKGAKEEAERQLVSVKKLKGEVTRKEGMLKATQAELDKARQEIAEVTAAAQEAAGKGQHAQHQSNSSMALAVVREQARGVLAALRSLSKLVLRTSAAMQAAASSLQAASCAPSGQDEVSAAAVARMVDMSLEEVADLLGGAAASGPGDTDTALLAREAAHVLLQLDAAICSDCGKSTSPTRNRGEAEWDRQALDDVMDSIQQQASRAEAVLAEAISTAGTKKHSDIHIAAHQGRRRKKAAADPVAKLEEDLLRASHGIEAELYQDL